MPTGCRRKKKDGSKDPESSILLSRGHINSLTFTSMSVQTATRVPSPVTDHPKGDFYEISMPEKGDLELNPTAAAP